MRLAAKLILLFLFGLLLIVGLFAFLTIQQDRQLAIAEHQRHASDLAATLQPSIERAIRERKTAELPQVLTQSTRQLKHVRVRWVEYSSRGDRSRLPAVPMDMILTQREVTTISMPDDSGHDHLYTYIPISSDGNGQNAGIEISAPDTETNSRVRRSLLSSLVALLGVATLSGLVIMLGGIKMVGEPLNQLIGKVHRAGQGDFSRPVTVGSRDELGQLGTALNGMCDQLAAQRERIEREAASRIATVEQLRHADRLNTVGRLAAGIAHEIGTPLNVVTGRAELIASGQLSVEASQESARAIQSEAQRITKIIRELLDFSRPSTPQRSKQNLNELIAATANLLHPLVAKRNAAFEVQMPTPPLFANIDPGQIQQVLTNVIHNAVQSTNQDGRVKISLSDEVFRPKTNASGDPDQTVRLFCRIVIEDNGAGISDEDQEHLFEPFFTTKDVGEGTGLGLSISHGIISEHEGWIEVESEIGRGSRFSIFLPVAARDGESA